MTELKKMASVDTSNKTVRGLIWLLLDTSLLASGFNLNVPTLSAGRIHRIIKLGQTIDDDDDGGSCDGDDPPPFEKVAEEGLDPDHEDDVKQLEDSKTDFEPLIKLIKEVLGDRVEKVAVSSRKVVHPCVLTTAEHGWSTNTGGVLVRRSTFATVRGRSNGVSPKHSIMSQLQNMALADTSGRTVETLIWLFFRHVAARIGLQPG